MKILTFWIFLLQIWILYGILFQTWKEDGENINKFWLFWQVLQWSLYYCDFVFLCASPLPCIVVIGEENQISEIFVYSINGELYIRQKEHGILKSPVIAKDLNSNEYLVYIIDDSIIIRALPTLIRQSSIDEVKNVCAICPSEDMRLIYAINKSGSCIKVIKDQI